MEIIVQKFGGTSVANLECMKRVREVVACKLDQGVKVAVVLSAMAGETNRLISLAESFSTAPDPSELDVLVTTGEQASVSLFSMLLKDAGVKARSLLGHQIQVRTSCEYGNARILDIEAEAMKNHFQDNDVLVIAGFQGCDEHGRLTTLGRGGSDTSAVALAAALGASSCEIYTDVEGVYTTDPNICDKARKLDRVSYDEMLEMASMGAKVLQIRSVEFAKKYGVNVHVRSTFSDTPGTIVSQEVPSMEHVLVSGIAYDKDQARVTIYDVLDQPGVASSIFGPIAREGILVDMIIQNTSRDGHTDMTFTVPRKDLERTVTLLKQAQETIHAKDIQSDTGVCKVSVIGVGMRNHSGVASKAFEALAREGINLLMISTSEIKITMLLEDKYAELAVRTLHEAFELDKHPEERVTE
ncbi:aspartate kinase [Desulfohalovibrio reitneri]|uniref:aspartate kinase n=1 Tax=Desulfohalovibrio reitneri TaxID=1307759 RepID=UPI0004A6D9EF|nr:aspartate kinase [Desulfohalovibrio reitneri]